MDRFSPSSIRKMLRANPDRNSHHDHVRLALRIFRGICSGPFLESAFRTVEFRIRVTTGPGETWSYDEDTVLQVRGRAELFHHRDRNTLTRIAGPTPNPLAR